MNTVGVKVASFHESSSKYHEELLDEDTLSVSG
jgi:hypothetical protein